MVEDNSRLLTDRVRAGELDLALIGTTGEPPPGLGALSITSERIVSAVAFEHPLAGSVRSTLSEIGTWPILCVPEGTAPRALFNHSCATKGIVLNIVLQASARDAVADLAARGLGVAIVTESMAVVHQERLRALVIDDVVSTVGLALIWKASKGTALQVLITRSREAFSNPLSRQVIPSGGRAAR
ncbi:MAG: hypothetical protein HIU84_09480 [Acidobacteria bacterium]|nr:hypothetical protein [Acidobacteriota bacterium]